MFRMNGNDIRNMIAGATIFGGGGGGACESGNAALDQFKEDRGIISDEDLSVQVIDVSEMDANGYAACTAAMGAPTKFKEVRIAPYINGSFDHLCHIANEKRKEIMYSIAVEIGGFNTLVPLLVAMGKGIPFVDADGTGRAVPALDTLLLHINGLKTSPLAMSDNKANHVAIELEDARDARCGEEIGRNLCVAFGQMAGLSSWMVKKDEIANNLPLQSVTKCMQVGEVLRGWSGSTEGIFDALATQTGLQCKEFARGRVTHVENSQASGFDKGIVEITTSGGDVWRTHFLNENLIVEKNGVVQMTAPDITCYIDADTGAPLSNADIVSKEGQILVPNVIFGAVKVDEKWWSSSEALITKIWQYYFEILGKSNQPLVKYVD